MAEQVGKIEKPSVTEFTGGRKIYFVPLVFSPMEPIAELEEKIANYWQQVEEQLFKLEVKLGMAHRIFHEMVPMGGEDGVKGVEILNKGSYAVVSVRVKAGASLEAMEDADLLAEFMDWSRCVSIHLQSEKVFRKVYEFVVDAEKRRNAEIVKRLDEGLKDNETGILLMREGHQLQFPPDIQVFYVAPPALDDIKRWARDRKQEARKQEEQHSGS